jgi:hypothetical protein
VPFSPTLRNPIFGDGSLGDVTIDGTPGNPAVATTYGPMCYRNLTIGANGVLQAPGTSWGPLSLYVRDTLTIAGRISADAVGEVFLAGGYLSNGGNGQQGLGGSAGTLPMLGPGKAGTYMPPRWVLMPILGGGGGGGSGGGGGASKGYELGSSGSTGVSNRYNADNTGVNGGLQGAHNGSNGNANVPSGYTIGQMVDGQFLVCAGCGGGQGGQSSDYDSGGDGGAGGGVILIYARRIVIAGAGIISANGASGSAGSATGTGGGGGGGGGGIFITCETLIDGVVGTNITVTGGAGGLRDGATAGSGGNGDTGVIRIWRAN